MSSHSSAAGVELRSRALRDRRLIQWRCGQEEQAPGQQTGTPPARVLPRLRRCGVAVAGPGLTDAVTGTDPLKDERLLLSSEPADSSPEVRNLQHPQLDEQRGQSGQAFGHRRVRGMWSIGVVLFASFRKPPPPQ